VREKGMDKPQTLRGFRDIAGEEIGKFRRIEAVARKYLKALGFEEIEIPVLERTDLFVRSIGDATDIVEKEMFTFTDLGGDSVTLRPEATAGVVRAYLQTGMYARQRVSKLFTMGPMFRHERPQKGRFREFRQIDVEVFGVDDPLVDAEFLWMISRILGELGVADYHVEVNSVGCAECRKSFTAAMVKYFGEERDRLCGDCVRRLEKNPLRIFDCKVEECKTVGSGSPLLFDALCDSCRDHFDRLMHHLGEFGVAVSVNKRLVRGLDYYTRTVFEVVSGELGAQSTFIAGGRYENLVEELGGPATPGSGFAIGVERLSLITPAETPSRQPAFFFAYLGAKAGSYVIPLQKVFVEKGLSFSFSYEAKSLKSQMRYADSLKADYVLILGDDEIAKGSIVVRNMRDKGQREVPLDLAELSREMDRITGGNA
jgi:histidyl-tRNA synthetase